MFIYLSLLLLPPYKGIGKAEVMKKKTFSISDNRGKIFDFVMLVPHKVRLSWNKWYPIPNYRLHAVANTVTAVSFIINVLSRSMQ